MTPGWDEIWEAARHAVDPEGAWAAVRIAVEHRGAYEALAGSGASGGSDLAWVELTGRAFHAAADKRELPTVGDWVLVEQWGRAVAGGGAAVVRAILPRRSFLVRRAAGEATAPQPLAANVDVGIVMTSANTDLSIPRLDRYANLLRDGGIEPVIVVSKVDLATDLSGVLETVKTVGPRVIAASAVTGVGLSEIRELCGAGKTCAVLGSSGVGKSTLLNALLGAAQETREIRADERGRHTTTRRELIVAPDGSSWIDTPGMRELAQWVEEEDEEEPTFDDIEAASEGCKFRDCGHRDEPGCAVRGTIDPVRVASFHKLAGERQEATARQAAAKRIAESRKARKKPRPND